MMKKLSTTLLLVSIFITFAIFISHKSKSFTVLTVETPTKITVSKNISKKSNKTENICIEGIDSFSLTNSNDNIILQNYNLTQTELISLGYLAQEYALKTLLNQKVSLKYSSYVSKDCKYANIYINGTDYKKLLENNGFGITNKKINNIEKFEENLNKARKLDLVILNHHSGKYHTLDCPYGEIAHDKVILPKNQLADDSIPCKFCNNNQSKVQSLKLNRDIFEVTNIIQPKLTLSHNGITTIMTDFTKTIKPNTQCNNVACTELIKQINQAKSSIDIAIYGYREVPAITSAIKRAKSRGVKIRYIYDSYFDTNKNYYPHNRIIESLSDEYKTDKSESPALSNMLMHNKFIIFDKKIVYTGSMNLSSTGTSGYDVNSIVILDSPEIASLYSKEFEQMMSGKFHTEKDRIPENRIYKLNNTEVEVYFSPKDKTSNRIIELINGAQTYIYVPTFLITHSGIAKALINAKARGIDVRVIIDANSVTTKNTKHALLRKSNVMLKTENYAGKMHSKSMIIDDLYFITGSMNFSNSGENKNDENTIIIKDKDIAQLHKNIFLYLWTKIPNKYLNKNAKPESLGSRGSCQDGIDNNFNNKTDKEESYCNI